MSRSTDRRPLNACGIVHESLSASVLGLERLRLRLTPRGKVEGAYGFWPVLVSEVSSACGGFGLSEPGQLSAARSLMAGDYAASHDGGGEE
jgi:hypothetical protein